MANILCYNIDKGLMEAIALNFLPKGFQIYKAYSEFDMKKIVYSKQIQLIIVDISISAQNKLNVEFLKWISFVDQKNFFKKIIISNVTNKNVINKVMELGITSFISKKNSTSFIVERLDNIIEKIEYNDERKHLRIVPEESEKASISLYTSNDENVVGKILNISMGGVLALVSDPILLLGISKGDFIKRIQISINNKKIIVDGVIVAKRKNMLAIKYEDLGEHYKEILAKYIFEKIS